MATIGTFHKDDNGNFTGAIKTLTLNVKQAVIRKVETDNDKAPNFRIFSGQTEFGPPGTRPPRRGATTSRSSWTTRASTLRSTPAWWMPTTATA